MKNFIYSLKRAAKVLIDAVLFGLSLTIAYKLRLEHHLSSDIQNWFWKIQLPTILCFVVFIRVWFLFLFQAYSKMWRYTEINELLEILKPIILSSLFLSIPRILGYSANNTLFTIPIGVIIIDSALSLIFLSTARLIRKLQIANRAIRKRVKSSDLKNKKRTVLIGAGTAAYELSRKLEQHPEIESDIVCALDDDIRKKDTILGNNIKVIGEIKELKNVVEKYNIEQIIIAIPSLPPKQLREIIELCQATKLETKTIAGVDQLAGGKVSIEQIRKVSLEDLLGREPVDLSIPEVANYINDKTILITGAGGSIGSELTKQLIKNFKPKQIFILGRGENSIFQLSQDLQTIGFKNFKPIICDIRNYNLLLKQVKNINPDVVFHAAAHKHVPLMEDHPIEAFENNVLGTKNIAEISGMLGVKTFVNISTDKAVNPINVLGCTKRLAELIVISCAKEFKNTKYISVRFGNVIGSRGSVIPIWEYQLKNNLPLTITDKNTYRFFMTILEAAQLVIKSGAIGKSSEIMVLDMGSEVSIFKLVNDFITLSGFEPQEITLNFTGLRPGEKLKEELVGYYEGANSTKHKKILVVEQNKNSNSPIKQSIEKLTIFSQTQIEREFKDMLVQETRELNGVESKALSEV